MDSLHPVRIGLLSSLYQTVQRGHSQRYHLLMPRQSQNLRGCCRNQGESIYLRWGNSDQQQRETPLRLALVLASPCIGAPHTDLVAGDVRVLPLQGHNGGQRQFYPSHLNPHKRRSLRPARRERIIHTQQRRLHLQ